MDFFHSGDLGDVIYSLPVIKAMGGGRLFLHDEPGVETMHRMSVERVKLIGPLLVKQPYIQGVAPLFPSGNTHVVNLNLFRQAGLDFVNIWLPEVQALTWGLSPDIAKERWLHVNVHPNRYVSPVIFSRSQRYRNTEFKWPSVIAKYGKYAVFIGTPEEHAAFNTEYGCSIDYYHTPTLLDAAEIIASCDLFVGNQSAPLAIAEGLKKRIICEVCPRCPNCISPRPDFLAGWGENMVLPEL
jgi:hypothetical protein